MTVFNRRTMHALLSAVRRKVRWLARPPQVRGAVPPMFPGALRMDEAEEEAAVAAVREVMRSKKLFRYYGPSPQPFQGSRARELEQAFIQRFDVPHALAVNSGTSALVCALAALDIGPGDEVIVPAYTWVSSASAVIAVGAVPIIAEVDESLTLDPEDVRRRLSPFTRAIMAVHIHGAPARLDVLGALCRDNGLLLIEDVAQALGGCFGGRPLGTLGDIGAYSFQMSKILTAGEGGLVVTADRDKYLRAAMYHDSAVCPHMGVPMPDWLAGVNLRMSELHAAILLVQVTRLEQILADMRARKAQVKSIIREPLERRGMKLRAVHDAEGDTGTAVIFFVPDAQRAPRIVTALADENVPASRLYLDLAYLPHDHVDLHACPAWTPILNQRSWSRSGEPWRSHPRAVSYVTDPCTKTIDLLRRAVRIDISPDLTERQADEIGAAIVAVAEKFS
ncbi:MAG: DegT/DnrJ/EryC1/StrS family aminotransferase [Burkholderiales bacterium]